MRLAHTRKSHLFPSLAIALALLAQQTAAEAQPFSNTAAINFPTADTDGRATLYPSPIVVAEAPASIGYLSVTLSSFSHAFVSDVNVLLVSPTGQKILLMANTNGAGDANGNTLTFIPDGTTTLPEANFPGIDVVSGFYACSVYSPQNLPDPAPAGPYGASLDSLIGTNANGTWNLYVWDDFSTADNGSFAGGWSITFDSPPVQLAPTAMTYQGVLASAGVPINGNANVRFTLCYHPTVSLPIATVAPAITRSFSGVQNGLITTTLDFGSIVDSLLALWLNIEVESPPGSGFVTLTPRQALTPVPQARAAETAVLADTAQRLAFDARIALNDQPLLLRGANDPNHGLRYMGGAAPFASSNNVDGPALYGFNGGVLGSTEGIERIALRWDNLGNVGIGTTTPNSAFRLHAVGDGDTQIGLTGGPATGGIIPPRTWTIQSSNVNGPLNQLTGSFQIIDRTAGAARLLIDTSGNVGIGTSFPAQRLVVAGNVQANNVTVPSSGRFKHNVLPMSDALDKLLKLDGVTFDWNPDFAKDRPGREHDLGFVAEDVAKVFPEVVFFDSDGKVSGMDYSRLTAVAVQAIKQQQAQRESDRAKFDAELAKRDAEAARRDVETANLRTDNAELRARLDTLERLVNESRSQPR